MSRPRKETHLIARWSKREDDIQYLFPSRPDGHLIYGVLSMPMWGPGTKCFLDELKARGYDVKTLRFSVERKWPPNYTKPEPHQ